MNLVKDVEERHNGMIRARGRLHERGHLARVQRCATRVSPNLDQPFRRGDEIIEDVLLVLEHPRLMPRLAEFAAASQLRR